MFVVYVTTLLLAVYHWMVWWLLPGKGCCRRRSWLHFEGLSVHFIGGLRKPMRSLTLVGYGTEIWTQHLPNATQECATLLAASLGLLVHSHYTGWRSLLATVRRITTHAACGDCVCVGGGGLCSSLAIGRIHGFVRWGTWRNVLGICA